MKTSQGMVLMTTLMMLMLMTGLLLCLLQSVFLCMQINTQMRLTHHKYYALEVAAGHVVKQVSQLFTSSSCSGSFDGCAWSENQVIYRYKITDLGEFPCLKIGAHASHHWLVRFYEAQETKRMLELRVATPGSLIPCKLPISSQISAGLLSWGLKKIKN